MTARKSPEEKNRLENGTNSNDVISQEVLGYISEVVNDIDINTTNLEELKNHLKSISQYLKTEKNYKQEIEAYVLFHHVLSPKAKGFIRGMMLSINIDHFSHDVIFSELRAIGLIERFPDENIVGLFLYHVMSGKVRTAVEGYNEMQIYGNMLLNESSPFAQKIFIDMVTNQISPKLPSEAIQDMQQISKNMTFTRVPNYESYNFEVSDIINTIMSSDYDQLEAQHLFMVEALISDEETLKSEQEAFKLFYSLSEYSELYVRKYMKEYHICLLSDIIRIIYSLFFAENVFKPENKKRFFELLQKNGNLINLEDIFKELGTDMNDIQKFRKL